MSIILKALKKIQEQEAGRQPAPLPGGTPQGYSPGRGTEAEPGRAVSPSSADRQSFNLAPKALIGLLVVIALCTTGWFASRIYLNLKLAAGAAAPQAPAVSSEAPAAASPQAPAASREASALAAVAAVPAALVAPVDTAGAFGVFAEPDPSPPVQEQAAQPQEPHSVPAETPRHTQPVEAASRPVAPEASAPESSPREVFPEDETPVIESTVVEVSSVDLSDMERSPNAPVEKVPEKKGRPEFKINAIAWKNAEPRAIVNMQRIYEGDVIDGATVVAIKRKIVIFEYEGETFKVRF